MLRRGSDGILRLPFDAAADTWLLRGGRGVACQDCVESGTEIFAGDWQAVHWAAVIELSAVDKSLVAVEEKKVRRAGGAISSCYGLGLVIQVRKRISRAADFSRHFGARADLGYVRASNVLGSRNHADVLSYLGGPVLYPMRRRHFVTYAQALIGGARVTSAIPSPGGGFFGGFVNKLSWALGGGAESRVSSSMALRVGVDCLHTAYFDSSGIIRGQANLRIVGSVVYYFKRGSPKGPNNTAF